MRSLYHVGRCINCVTMHEWRQTPRREKADDDTDEKGTVVLWKYHTRLPFDETMLPQQRMTFTLQGVDNAYKTRPVT